MDDSNVEKSYKYLIGKELSSYHIKTAIICGSGLAQSLEVYCDVLQRISYNEIPGFPTPSVVGHSGEMIVAKFKSNNKLALVFSGRIHLYEGIALDKILHQVDLANILGIKNLIITCSIGSINRLTGPGSIGIIDDHIDIQSYKVISKSLMSCKTKIYDDYLSEKIIDSALRSDIHIRKGILASLMGPTYETPAESRMLRNYGIDWVSMSTTKEAFRANDLGMKVIGIVGVANFVKSNYETERSVTDHQEVLQVAIDCSDKLWKTLSGVSAVFD